MEKTVRYSEEGLLPKQTLLVAGLKDSLLMKQSRICSLNFWWCVVEKFGMFCEISRVDRSLKMTCQQARMQLEFENREKEDV